jgi:hypothetical protein
MDYKKNNRAEHGQGEKEGKQKGMSDKRTTEPKARQKEAVRKLSIVKARQTLSRFRLFPAQYRCRT